MWNNVTPRVVLDAIAERGGTAKVILELGVAGLTELVRRSTRQFHPPTIERIVVWAADDRFFPREHGERLAELLPQGRFELVAIERPIRARAGVEEHLVALEQPARVGRGPGLEPLHGLSQLGRGQHLITASATNSAGLTGRAEITLTVASP